MFKHKWDLTLEIEAIIRRDYKRIPTADVAVACRIPLNMVHVFARRLGLTRVKEPYWTEREIAFIRTVGLRTTKPLLATVLDRSLSAVRLKCKRLGICRRRIKRGHEAGWRGVLSEAQVRRLWKAQRPGAVVIPESHPRPAHDGRKIWTEAETAYLVEWVGQKRVQLIASYLGRSVRAVEHKMNHLGLSVLDNQGYLSTGLVMEALGLRSHTAIYAAIRRGLLTPLRPERRYFVFDPDEVERWRQLRKAAGYRRRISVPMPDGRLRAGAVRDLLGCRSYSPIRTAVQRGLLTPHRPGSREYAFDPAEVSRLQGLRADRRGTERARCDT